MDPERGFREAKKQFEWHFGNEMKLTAAHMGKVLSWPPIKAEDGPALRSYALRSSKFFGRAGDTISLEENGIQIGL